MNITFITGNQGKADFLTRHLGHPVEHRKIDLDEVQSLDLEEIAGHKAKQAFGIIKSPVLVEDVSFTIEAMGGLPGPFIKWFEQEIGLEGICRLADVSESRRARITVCFAYCDKNGTTFFHGELKGTVADSPCGANGFGFDPIFIRERKDKTLAEMSDVELEKFSLRTSTVYPEIKRFLAGLDKTNNQNFKAG